jgi:hypothetical protein
MSNQDSGQPCGCDPGTKPPYFCEQHRTVCGNDTEGCIFGVEHLRYDCQDRLGNHLHPELWEAELKLRAAPTYEELKQFLLAYLVEDPIPNGCDCGLCTQARKLRDRFQEA